MTFTVIRQKIVDAAQTAGSAIYDKDTSICIQYNELIVPQSLPAVIITRTKKTGILGTAKRYVEHDHTFTIYLVVNAQEVTDPDADIDAFECAFNEAYKTAFNKDYDTVEYYPSRMDARDVRIAKIQTAKGLE